MKRKSLFLAAILFFSLSTNAVAKGSYPPAAGQLGSTAIHKDSSIIVSWATGIEIYRGLINIADPSATNNGSNLATFGYPSFALSAAQGNSTDVVSLGDGGNATLTFNRPIINGFGPDFAVFENGFSDTFLELAFVEVSSDGKRFVRFPAVSLTQTETQVGGFGALDATNIHNFAGKYRQAYGTPFDLEDIKDSIGIDVNNIRFIKVVDVVGSIDNAFATYDSQGNKVNDPWPTAFNSGGFDLDAVGVINAGNNFTLSDLNNLSLTDNSYWNGSDNSGGFYDNGVFYPNSFDQAYESWFGFSYSNMQDNTTGGFTNQYSAYTRGGMDATEDIGTNYGVAFVPNDWLSGTYDMIPIEAVLETPTFVSGFYVTNSTYAYLLMLNGDWNAKKFGGVSGNDPDYFKLLVWGERNDGTQTDTVGFYLADYRFEDNSQDYLVNNWRWVDLLTLGEIKKVKFSLESSDVGLYGMNTPSFFCIDNLTLVSTEGEPNILILANPIANVVVERNALPLEIDLSQVFLASDFTSLSLSITSNTNNSLVSTSFTNKILTLTFADGQIGEAEIVVRAELNGHVVNDAFMVTVNNTTNIYTNTFSEPRAYPNPFNSQLTVEANAGSTVMVFDLFGRKILETKNAANSLNISTDNFNPGFYIVKISDEQCVKSIKVLKK